MENDDYDRRFGGMARLMGLKTFMKVRAAKILVIGIGGVGSWVAESLARSGVCHMTLVDLDDICVTNINRQVHAHNETVGKFKIDVMKERILLINPFCEVDTKQSYFSPKNLESIFDKEYDFVVDACDDFNNKCHLVSYCRSHKIPLMVVGAAGGKIDPLQIRITDLLETENDKMLSRLRKTLRREFNFPRDGEGEFGIWAVWSNERAVYPTADGCLTHKAIGEISKNMDCSSGFGSASFVTGAFAFAATSFILRKMTNHEILP